MAIERRGLVTLCASALALVTAAVARPAPPGNGNASPVYGVTRPPGYRAWQAVGVAHEGPPLNDIRLILANPVAMMAFRSGARPFPDGSIIARLAYRHEASARNDAVFGRKQSFVAGEPTNVQIEIKDSRRFRSTGGWGYAQFERGRADLSESVIATCSACHRKLPDATDLIFTAYVP